MKYVSLDKLSRFKDKLLEILMLKSTYDSDSDGQVEKADLADNATKLATARTITIGRQSNSFDGTANKTYTPESIFGVYYISSTRNATYTDKYAKIGTFTVTSTYQNFYAVLQVYDVESGNFGGLLYIRLRSSSATTTYSNPIVSWLGMTPSGDYMNRVYITQDSNDKTKYYVYIKLSSSNYRTIDYRVLINVGSITFSSVSSSAFTDSMTGTTVVTSSVAYALSSHTHSNATTSANGFMSSTDKTKLDGIATGANNYTLPTATSSVLGGVKTGSNITNSSGTISVTKDNVINALGYTPGSSTVNVDTITLGTTWTTDSTNGYVTQDVTLSGITANDYPILDVVLSGTKENMETLNSEWAKMLKAETSANKITFYFTEATTVSLSVLVRR